MAGDFILNALARVPLFQGLTSAQIDEIAARAQRAIYHPGGVIIEENAEGHAAVLILSGEAARVSGPELSARIEPVFAGALVGEAAMLIETTHTSTVVARGEVRALHLLRDELHAQILEDPSLGEALTRNIAARLIRMADELRQVDAALGGGRVTDFGPVPQPQPPAGWLPTPVH
jgi:CRP-like cAMP-binding protein